MQCKLCRSPAVESFFSDPPRTYIHCKSCDLIFTTENSYLSPAQEKERYEMHDNSEANDGYVRFLQIVAEMVIATTPAAGSVLDFGCGKNAVLEGIIKRQCSLKCDSYDPQFNRIIDFSGKKYDTIVVCEVIEHLRNLQEELVLINKLVKTGGKMIIRTQKYGSMEVFPAWWYRQDTTHINFFNDTTLSFVASLVKRKCVQTTSKDIVILQPESQV